MTVNKDDVIKRINERLKLTSPHFQFDMNEPYAPAIHALVAVMLEVVEEEVHAAATQANEQIKRIQEQLDIIRPRVL